MSHSESVVVIIPVHNCERYLGDAIDSALSQTECPAAILVIDDGSTDRTADVVMRYGSSVRYHRQDKQGAAAARNKGVAMSGGKWIAFLDSDDLWLPDKLEQQTAVCRARPDLDMVFAHIEEFVSPDSLRAKLSSEPAAREGGIPALAVSGCLVKREVLGRVGPFSVEFGVGEFIDWFARAIDSGSSYSVVPKVLVRRRIHDSNQGVMKREDYQRDYLRILKKTLDRRRQRGASES